MSSPTPLRRELLASLGILFGGVTLLLGIAISLVLPYLRSTVEATVFILVIVAVCMMVDHTGAVEDLQQSFHAQVA